MKSTQFALIAFLSLQALAQDNSTPIENFYKLFKKGNYQEAVASLKNVPSTQINSATNAYLTGLCYARLQEFDKAYDFFKKAQSLGSTASDLYYEMGQALYAMSDLQKSRQAFKKSVEINFNKPTSLYYVAHISQILEEHLVAKEYFGLILKEREADAKIRQVAKFQLAETILLMARDEKKSFEEMTKFVSQYVLPLMKQAIDEESGSSTVPEINGRITEIQREFNLDPNYMVNGRKISAKRFNFNIGQKIKYDSNVTNASEQASVTASKKEAFISDTDLSLKYDWVLKQKYTITPDFKATHTYHSDRTNASVYENDAYSLTGALRNKIDHKIGQTISTFLFDYDYNYTAKDRDHTQKRIKYSNATTYTLGERLKYFSKGDTTIKLKYKDYTAYSNTLYNKTTSVSIDQAIAFSNQTLLIILGQADLVDSYNNTTSSTDSYLLRFDYIIPEFFPTFTLGIGMATTFLDTKKQKATRGMEKTYNPSLDLSKDITANFKLGINYDYSKTTSKSVSNEYTKQTLTTEFRYTF